MLVIRKQQMDVLGRVPRLAFEDSLVKHFRRFYPLECRYAGPANVRKLIRFGMERAPIHDYHTQREVGIYVNLMVMLGCDFDRDPLLPWAAEQLNDSSIENSFTRIQRVFQSALQYLDTTSGPANALLFAALRRIRTLQIGDLPASTGVKFENDLIEILQRCYPEKFGHHARNEIIALIRECSDVAWDIGIHQPAGRTVCIVLAFMLGSGIFRDPLYPWVNRALASADAHTEEARVALLHGASVKYIDFMMSGN